jgi:hypothetical protein
MSDGLFNTFAERYRPLSEHLKSTVARPLAERLRRVEDLDGLDDFEKRQLPKLLQDLRVDPPYLGGSRQASHGSGEVRQTPGSSLREPTTRFYVAVQVHGDRELLLCWPDEVDPGNLPVDAASVEEAGGLDDLAHGDPADVSRYWHESQTWTLGAREETDDGFVDWALYTYVELTAGEEQAVSEGRHNVQEIFAQRRAYIEPIVGAIAAQTTAYFDHDLPTWMGHVIAERRRALTHRSGVLDSLKFENEWRYETPKLAPEEGESAAETDEVAAEPAPQLTVEHRARLDPATFADVQRIIRVWADAVQRHPVTMTTLSEDQLSDLLAATLNANVPGAQREVYRRTGKTDIQIRADVLAEGYGPEVVFVCESKYWHGAKAIQKALGTQLFSYLTSDDTSAILLIYIRERRVSQVRENALAALRQVPGYTGEVMGDAGWPVLDYDVDGRQVHVCVADVHVPARPEAR